MNRVVAIIICALLVLGAAAHAQFNPGGSGGGGGGGGGSSTPFADFIDPTVLFAADTTGTATTGTITNGTNSLAVASAATWSVGQGIAVANAGPSATFTGTAGTTSITVAGQTFTVPSITASSVTGTITAGMLVSGTGVPAGTYIGQQTSGTTGGAGVYVVSATTTASAASLTGGTELIGCVNSITGTTFTIVICGTTTPLDASVTATTQAVNHDDTYALVQSIALAAPGPPKRPISIPCGTYNVTNVLVLRYPLSIFGTGISCAVIQNRGTTNDVFKLTNDYTTGGGMAISNLAIEQASGITPTSGYGIDMILSDNCVPQAQVQTHLSRIYITGTYSAWNIGPGVLGGYFEDIVAYQTVSLISVYQNNPMPCGDNFIYGLTIGTNGPIENDFIIAASDTTSVSNVKITQGKLKFASTSPLQFPNKTIGRMRITNLGVERNFNIPSDCLIDFGTYGAQQITIMGGEFLGQGTPTSIPTFCNANLNTNGTVQGMVSLDTADYGSGVINEQWPAPVFQGCSTNGTATGGSLGGYVTMTCSMGSTMSMRFTPPDPGASTGGILLIPTVNAGWTCTVLDATDPTKLFTQTGWTSSIAFFKNVATGTGDQLTYNCRAGGPNIPPSCWGPGDAAPALAWHGLRAYSSATCGAAFANVCVQVSSVDTCQDMFTSATTGAVVPLSTGFGGTTCPNTAGTCTIKKLYDQTQGMNCGGSCDLISAGGGTVVANRFQFYSNPSFTNVCMTASVCMYDAGTAGTISMTSAGSASLSLPFSFEYVGYMTTIPSSNPQLISIGSAGIVGSETSGGVNANHYFYSCNLINGDGALDLLSTQLYPLIVTCPAANTSSIFVYTLANQTVAFGSSTTQTGQLSIGFADTVLKVLVEDGFWNSDQTINTPLLGSNTAAFWGIP